MSTELRGTHPLLGTRVNKGRDGRLTPPPLASGWSRHPIGYGDPQNDEVKGHRQQFCGSKESHHEEQRRSEEHTSELQSRQYLVCRLLLEKKKIIDNYTHINILYI